MRPEQLKEFISKLNNKRQQLIDQIARLEDNGLNAVLSNTTGELSSYDNHPGDLGSETFERAKDLGLKDNERVLLANVERALAKAASGTYGCCNRCGAEIPLERLEALPWALQCMECQQASEHPDATPRPLEEEALEPPFHRTFLDTADFVGFDGEDALQAVMRYGSSDTPQDLPGTYNYKALFPNSNEHQGIVEPSDAIPALEATSKSTKKSYDKFEKTGR